MCLGQTRRFDEITDLPQGSPCPFLISRFIVHVTEEGTAEPGLQGQPCCGMGDQPAGTGCALGLSCASGICVLGPVGAVPVPTLSTNALILCGLLLAGGGGAGSAPPE